MSDQELKGKSPFYPGQPVPTELFVGRANQVDHIMTRGAAQVALGKPVAIFVQGEYGIGKSSIASFLQYAAEAKHHLHPIYAQLGGCKDLNDVAAAIVQATVQSGVYHPDRSEKIRNWLAKYVGKQSLGGITLNMEALRKDAPTVASVFGLLGFLNTALDRIKDTGANGIFLVLDEVNGITKDPQFAAFIKGLVDTNARAPTPLPLLLMMCGVGERLRDMIECHQAIDRVFDVVEIPIMSEEEMKEFFKNAFESVRMTVTERALGALAFYSAGLPKIMHIVGDEAFWADQDGIVDHDDAARASIRGAEEVGKRFVDQQVYAALRSADYRAILEKIANRGPFDMAFKKADVVGDLTTTEKGKFNNFLQKMKAMQVLRSGDDAGEYVFNVRMVRVYIWLASRRH